MKLIDTATFYNCSDLTSITIPSSVTTIANGVFSGCSNLSSITIPNSVTSIGGSAFANCNSLASIAIPNSVMGISERMFNGYSGLTSVDTEIRNPFQIDETVFSGISSNATLQVPQGTRSKYETFSGWTKHFKEIEESSSVSNYTLSIKATGNGSASYNGNTIKNQTSTFTVNEGTSATISFTPDNGNRIKNVKVNNTDVTASISNNSYTISSISANTTFEVEFEIDDDIFTAKTIEGIDMTFKIISVSDKTCQVGDGIHDAVYLNYSDDCLTIPSTANNYSVISIGKNAFRWDDDNEVKELEIPATITKIGEHAFYSLKELRDVYIRNMEAWLKIVFDDVYSNPLSHQCNLNLIDADQSKPTPIQNLIIPKTISAINDYAFYGCYSVKSVTFHNQVTAIGINAFGNCNNLQVVTVGNSNPIAITGNTFSNRKSAILKVPYGSKEKYETADYWKEFKEIIEYKEDGTEQYTLSIKATGNGTASYNGNTIKNQTSGFTVNEGASTTITLSPDESYKIKRVTIDNTDVLSDIQNNRITLQNIIHDIQVDIHFENKCDSLIKAITETNELLDTEVGNCKKLLEKLKELVEKAKEIDANKYVSYESKYAEYSIALRGCEDNRHSMEQGYSTYLNRYNEYGIEDMGIEYVNTYSDGFNSVLNTAKQLQASLDNLEENISKTYNQLNEELNNLPQTVTYTISITSSGSGSASYDGTSVRNDTKSFTVNEGTSATITFTSDTGCQIASVKVNNADVTTAIANNSYTISDIRANTTLEVVFEVMLTTVTAAGVNYTITSQALQTVSVTNGNYGQVLTVPATVTEHGKTWTVTGIETNALSGNTQLAAIIWNPEVAFTATVSNPNMLLYVKAERYAPSAIHNVVVNGTANSIVLTDAQSANNFYCPQMFTARSISYTHNYRMTTGIGESRGWETIALPFDVQTITHETKGDIMPFAKWKSGDNRKPFWLYELTGSGFVEAGSIKAYTPYIISMPNNAQYDSQWLLNGNVTFSASNVIVGKTEDMKTATYRERTFVPNYADMGAAEGLYALNVSNDITTNNSGMTEGSKFVLNMRQVHPFEAYMTSSSNARTYFDIFDDLSTDIKEELIVRSSQFMVGERVYDLQGRKVEHPSKEGVYIVNGKKMVIK